MKNYLLLSSLLFANVCFAQFTDDFTDGNFTTNPVWAGSTNRFVVSSNQLRLQAPAVTDVAYLSTVSHSIENASWEFSLKLDFNPSNGNYTRVYLVSDQADLAGALNGYFVLIGDTPDEISLYRQTGTTRTKIIDGVDGRTNLSVVNAKVKVIRDASGLWTLFSDIGPTNNLQTEGSVTDITHTVSSYAGVFCNYTATRNSHFYFDNFAVTGTPVMDITAPVVQSVEVSSATEITLTFSEALNNTAAETPSNYTVIGTLAAPSSAALLNNQKSVKLTFFSPFENGVLQMLSFSGIKDLALNGATGQVTFRYFVPIAAAFNDIVINELFPDPSPQIGLPSSEFLELYNRSSKPFDLAGWKLKDLTSVASLPSAFLLPGQYLILCNTSVVADYAAHGETLGVANFPTLNNSGDAFTLIDPNGLTVDSVNYSINWFQDEDKAQGGYTLERLNPQIASNEPTNWRASVNANGGTPGQQNSLFGENPDVVAPAIVKLEVVSSQLLKLTFSEPLDIAQAEEEANYAISDGTRPNEATLSGDVLMLHFSETFTNGKSDTLVIEIFSDAAGNIVNATKVPFRYFVATPATQGCILFNEIMADPTPVVQLPEAEYIEVVNASSSPFDLQGWELSDATTTTSLPSFVLLPGEFLILTSSTNKTKFSSYGHVLGVPNFPSLNNTGESLVIRDSNKQKIDSLSYVLAWYQNDEKKEGGFSLERLQYDLSSIDDTNWRASESITGGTPGTINSVFGKNPDIKSPELVRLEVATDHDLTLVFNEALSPVQAMDVSNFAADKGLGNPAKSELASSGTEISLHFSPQFTNGVTYILTVRNIIDTASNTMPNVQKQFLYFAATPASKKDIVFTEIMADPTPVQGLPEAEYVEIFNRSAHPFDLKDWQISDGSSLAYLPPQIILPNSYWILTTTSQALKFASFGNVLGVPGFPSLNNGGESLRLKTPGGITVDSVNFTMQWYKNSEKAEGGWALELIDLQNTCGEEDNWVASESENGGSPGTTNSVNANKPDVSGPRLLSAIPVSETIILVQFNEKLAVDLLTSDFTVSPARLISSARFTDTSLREVVITLEEGLLPRMLYRINTEVSDCAGNLIDDSHNSLTFALTEEPDSMDVVINEVLFNPRPGESDYVEIYNRSEKYLDLKGWAIAKAEVNSTTDRKVLATDHLLMAPGSFFVFTPLLTDLLSNHPRVPTDRIVETQLPSLPDDEGGLTIQSRDGISVDTFHYQSQMHSPIIKDDEGVSLERISYHANTNDVNNWTSASSTSGFGTPGQPNSNLRPAESNFENSVLISPEIFSPGQTFTQIQYRFEQPGQMASVKILDMQGHPIKEVATNVTLGSDGFFRWDGDRSDATIASSGYYVVWFELFDVTGGVKTFRKRVVVANR